MDALQQARDDAAERVVALLASRAELMAATEGANSDDEHDPEGATLAFERQQLAALIAQAEQSVRDADAAMVRRDAGTYGVCGSCGRPIGAERLAARPSTGTCISCA